MKKQFWVDFENAPHIPVLLPIVRALQEKGFEPVMTARDFSFTKTLIERYGLPARILGSGSKSRSSISKALKVAQRIVLLSRMIRPLRDELCFSIGHASRSMLITSHLLGITSVSLEDYEHSNQFHNSLSNLLLIPEPIPVNAFPRNRGRVIHYPGIKENIYLEGRRLPERIPPFIEAIGDRVKVLFRPEGRTAHYRSDLSEELQKAILEKLRDEPSVHILVYPRDEVQMAELQVFLEGGAADFSFPPVVDGPDLISSVDLVVGGGGTMTREAALLGIPSYTFFSGEWGWVDEHLTRTGDLIRITSLEEIRQIDLQRRVSQARVPDLPTVEFIVDVLASLGEGN